MGTEHLPPMTAAAFAAGRWVAGRYLINSSSAVPLVACPPVLGRQPWESRSFITLSLKTFEANKSLDEVSLKLRARPFVLYFMTAVTAPLACFTR